MHFFFLILRTVKRNLESRYGVTAALLALVFAYSTVGFKWIEGPAHDPELTWLDSAWWALVTMTTVGYGDITPTTNLGRYAVGYPTLIFGVALLGYTLSLLATVVFESRLKSGKGIKMLNVSDHILIIHFNSVRQITQLIGEIRKDDRTETTPITLIDPNLEELPEELTDLDVNFVRGDPATVSVLERANIKEAKSALVLADVHDPEKTDLRNLAVVLTLKSENEDIRTLVECKEPEHVPYFKRAGCHSVICLSAMASQILAQELQDPGINDVFDQLTSNSEGKQFYIVDIPARFRDFQSLVDAQGPDGVVMGLRRDGRNLVLPHGDTPIQPGDRAIMVASSRPFLGAVAKR